jgi:hypothetical protein
LSIIEKNFRNIMENHTRKMLEAKKIYWKSRAKIKWTKLGDENTKFFHTVATQQYRRLLMEQIYITMIIRLLLFGPLSKEDLEYQRSPPSHGS